MKMIRMIHPSIFNMVASPWFFDHVLEADCIVKGVSQLLISCEMVIPDVCEERKSIVVVSSLHTRQQINNSETPTSSCPKTQYNAPFTTCVRGLCRVIVWHLRRHGHRASEPLLYSPLQVYEPLPIDLHSVRSL